MATKTKKDTVKTETKKDNAVKSTKGKTPAELIEADKDTVLEKVLEITPDAGKKGAKGADKKAKPDADQVVKTEEERTEAEIAEAEALVARRNELLSKKKELIKRRSTASTKIKRGMTRKQTLEAELAAVLGKQSPEQLKMDILELEGEQESLRMETLDAEKRANMIRSEIDGIEVEMRVANGLDPKPKAKKKSSKPRVVNTQAIQRSALVRALETRGWVLEKAEGDETIDKVVSEIQGATVALMDGFALLDMEELETPVRIDFGKGAILNIEDAIEAA